MNKKNTYCLAQKVKAAAILQPSLIDDLLKKSTTNTKIVESVLKELIPYRTSVEIEHCLPTKHQSLLDHQNGKYKIMLYNLHTENFTANISWDCGGPESQLSLHNHKGLTNFCKALKILKKYYPIDENGSIHIHVDITNWLNNKDKQHKTIVGMMILSSPINSKYVKKFEEEILVESVRIAYPDKDYYSLFCNAPNNNFGKNMKKIGLTTYNLVLDRSLLQKIPNKLLSGYVPFARMSWINIRGDYKSIEIRTFPCSFDYETIIQFMIGANKLTKRILQICEYLGNKAIKNNYVID